MVQVSGRQEVAPRLRGAIPKTVPIVGPDDPEELLQDGIVIAVHLQESARKSGKQVSAGNIAHYTVLSLRSGRRSTGYKRNDVMHPAGRQTSPNPFSPLPARVQ